ncbi:unnamed protein product [Phaedon cochleariae]|uniref:Uncharacterized protein n=1 Tax=Phaedon cochleariae TaxID=80249 RepID=A0A9N9X5J1_PHACE|nr:unnamed protein product [Phaedon cochleariae]
MASDGGSGKNPSAEDSSDSDGETEPAKSFHRRLSTSREINSSCLLDWDRYSAENGLLFSLEVRVSEMKNESESKTQITRMVGCMGELVKKEQKFIQDEFPNS